MEFFGQQTINGLVLGSVFALYALGFGLVMANLKIFHVAHAGVFTWGAVIAWEFTTRWGWPLLVALPAVAILAGLVNVVSYFVLIRHLLGRRDAELAAFISSLGGLIILVELANRHLHGTVVRLPQKAFHVEPWILGPFRVTSLNVAMVALALVLILVTSFVMTRTQFGREVQTVAFSRETAALLGINVDRVSAGVFFLSGALAGVAASLVAMAFNIVGAELGSSYLVIALAAMIVGGFGSIIGTLIGGLLIGVASTYSTGYLESSYRDLVIFALLLVFLVFRPQGLIKTNAELDRV